MWKWDGLGMGDQREGEGRKASPLRGKEDWSVPERETKRERAGEKT
jgi:hypothetical protein